MHFKPHHVALSVDNISESVAFYELFGFKPFVSYADPCGEMKIEQLKLDDFILELFWFEDNAPLPDSEKNLQTDLKVQGTKHFGLKVDCLDETLKWLQDKGIGLGSFPKEGRTGVRYAFIKDPNGILIELSEDNRS